MKKRNNLPWAALVAASVSFNLASGQDAVTRDADTTERTDRADTEEVQAASYKGYLESETFVGAAVHNMEDEEIGTVDRILIDSATGKVKYVVLSVGGFLGIGDHHTAVPWSRLQFNRNMEVGETADDARDEDPEITIDATKEQLEKAPAYDSEKGSAEYRENDADDPVYKYWEEAEMSPRRTVNGDTETDRTTTPRTGTRTDTDTGATLPEETGDQ